MNTDEQNRAIAEALGYTHVHVTGQRRLVGCLPGVKGPLPLPDYTRSLDAMHEAEKRLTEDQVEKYQDYLDETGSQIEPECAATFYWFHATAAQRAEAFLRTLNLWQEP